MPREKSDLMQFLISICPAKNFLTQLVFLQFLCLSWLKFLLSVNCNVYLFIILISSVLLFKLVLCSL